MASSLQLIGSVEHRRRHRGARRRECRPSRSEHAAADAQQGQSRRRQESRQGGPRLRHSAGCGPRSAAARPSAWCCHPPGRHLLAPLGRRGWAGSTWRRLHRGHGGGLDDATQELPAQQRRVGRDPARRRPALDVGRIEEVWPRPCICAPAGSSPAPAGRADGRCRVSSTGDLISPPRLAGSRNCADSEATASMA